MYAGLFLLPLRSERYAWFNPRYAKRWRHALYSGKIDIASNLQCLYGNLMANRLIKNEF